LREVDAQQSTAARGVLVGKQAFGFQGHTIGNDAGACGQDLPKLIEQCRSAAAADENGVGDLVGGQGLGCGALNAGKAVIYAEICGIGANVFRTVGAQFKRQGAATG
jgi:hypothetical protein